MTRVGGHRVTRGSSDRSQGVQVDPALPALGARAARRCSRLAPAPVGRTIRLGPPYGVEDFLARVERNQVRIADASAALGVRAAEIVATLAEDLPDGTGPVLV